MAYSLTYCQGDRSWTLMATELGNLKRWCWERELKVIWDFVKLWTLLYWSYLRPTQAKIVEFAAEDSCQITWRLSSRRHWATSIETWGGHESRQRSNCTTTLVKWSDCEDLLEVTSRTTAIAGGVVSSIELFSYAQSGSRRMSTDVCESRQVVRQQACRPFPLYSV